MNFCISSNQGEIGLLGMVCFQSISFKYFECFVYVDLYSVLRETEGRKTVTSAYTQRNDRFILGRKRLLCTHDATAPIRTQPLAQNREEKWSTTTPSRRGYPSYIVDSSRTLRDTEKKIIHREGVGRRRFHLDGFVCFFPHISVSSSFRLVPGTGRDVQQPAVHCSSGLSSGGAEAAAGPSGILPIQN